MTKKELDPPNAYECETCGAKIGVVHYNISGSYSCYLIDGKWYSSTDLSMDYENTDACCSECGDEISFSEDVEDLDRELSPKEKIIYDKLRKRIYGNE